MKDLIGCCEVGNGDLIGCMGVLLRVLNGGVFFGVFVWVVGGI